MGHLVTIRKMPKSLIGLDRSSEEYAQAVVELEDTNNETFRLLQLFPKCADNGHVHIVNATLEDAFEPILVSEMLDDEGSQLQGGALVIAVGKLLVASDGLRSIHCTINDVQTLTESDYWLVWAQLIDDESELKEKCEPLGIKIDKRKTLEDNREIASAAIKERLK